MLAKSTVGLFFLLLIWGNIVAVLKAGLACPDWPLCHGQVVPPFRWDIYVEFSHRVLGAIASILLFILAVKRFRKYEGVIKSIPVITLVLLLIQVTLGGLVVLLKLPVNLTTTHFAIALLIFSLVLFLSYFDGVHNKPAFKASNFTGIFFLISVLVLTQAILGAYVRHSDAGLACPDFPKCLGYWVPPNLYGTVLIHFMHRIIAYSIFIILLVLAFTPILNYKFKKRIYMVLSLIVIQILLGVGIIHSKLFFGITALHIFVALLIIYILITTWYSQNTERIT